MLDEKRNDMEKTAKEKCIGYETARNVISYLLKNYDEIKLL
ncbi:MAG: hypothetical protein V1870_04890 [Candidatus Aenigmatarchaeota archaeon]